MPSSCGSNAVISLLFIIGLVQSLMVRHSIFQNNLSLFHNSKRVVHPLLLHF